MPLYLRNGDIIVLFSKDGGPNGKGFLASDVMGAFGSSSEHLLIAPAPRTPDGVMIYPPSFQLRCMFRIDTGHDSTLPRQRDPILYGQPIMLVHVNTDMYLTSMTKDVVQLQPDRHAGCFFVPEPRYKLRSEGERISSGDHLLLQSRRFAGAYLRISSGGHAAESQEALPASSKMRRTEPQLEEPQPVGFFASVLAAKPKPLAEKVDGAADIPEVEAPVLEDESVLLERESKHAQRVEMFNLRAGQGWVVQVFSTTDDSNILRAGECVRLFHREFEGYIMAALDTDKLREQDYPLDKILSVDRASQARGFRILLSLSDFAHLELAFRLHIRRISS
ncbi:hypothetical protein AB1Y20_003349 [Prymnesium parvum]|uniref:Inositol 1,4,5-trisphosphate/ryanodine receptor domain-containing protein n=1 Tax=Prymnesium parvum TaxID=97485 RepID=A0AB34JEB5_PRYPA